MVLKLHRVVEGPLQDPDDDTWSNIYLVETDDGTVTHIELEHDSMDDCYEMIKYFNINIDPIILEIDDECLTSNPN